MSFSQLHQNIKQATDNHLSKLIDYLPSHAPQLRDAMRYALLLGGKRVRPLLVHLVGEMLGVAEEDRTVVSMAIECIHAYSLVHDDLPAMDDDSLRRGQPTCHIAFGEATAILAGDALQTLAFTLLADYPMSLEGGAKRAQLISILAKASGYLGMCGGQAVDLAYTHQTLDISTLTQLHQLKTGALLCACAEMMTVLSENVGDNEKQTIINFARIIGLAFQVKDDLLDVEGDTTVIGKTAGADSHAGKTTFPTLLGIEGTGKQLALLEQQALQALNALPYNTESLALFANFMINRSY